MYTKKTEHLFKQKGLVNPETLKLSSTNKKTEGVEYDLVAAIKEVTKDGEEIEISVKQSNTDEDPEEYIE